MAKNIIEKPPFTFNFSDLNKMDYTSYVHYKATDEQGRYLYWDKFKWRVKKDDDVKKAWWATKFNRTVNRKYLSLNDKNNKVFSFCEPDAIQAKLYNILSLVSKGIVPHETLKQQYLISSLVMEEAISSSQLEGASTTRKIAKEILVSKKKPKNNDEQMIVNNYHLMQHIKTVRNEELTVDMILEFHAIATKHTYDNANVAGELRVSDDIVIMDRDDNIIHQPPEYKVLPQRLFELCYFANELHVGVNNTQFIHPISKAIILHFMIGYEHPFADGNGRTARALFYWFMLKQGYDFFEYISISKLLKQSPKNYSLSYMYSEIDDNDVTYFIDYQVDIINKAIDELLIYLKHKSDDYEEITVLLEDTSLGLALNFVQKDIIKKSIQTPGRIFTAIEVSVNYDISANTARKYLNELVKYKMLIGGKDGRSVTYIAPAKLHEIII
ncbi:MAG: Fic family protein, partial [Epsilonproteobacteria bacterium]